MRGIVNYELYFMSCLVMTLIPGTDTIFILTQSISHNRKIGVATAIGISTGLLVHTAFVGLGLAAIVKSSILAFQIIKYLGASYLVYLGIRSFMSKDSLLVGKEKGEDLSIKKAFFQGLITNILNPKVIIFFLAFIPQFIDAKSETYGLLTFVILGVTYFLLAVIWCSMLAYFASLAAEFLNRKAGFSGVINKVSGMIFILLGLNLLITKL